MDQPSTSAQAADVDLPRSGNIKLLWLLVALVGFAHLPLLISDSVLWDGTVFSNLLQERDYGRLLKSFSDEGFPQVGLLYWGLGLLPNYIFAFKLLAFGCILGSALCLFRLARQVPVLGEWEALFIAALAFIYPFYSLWFEIIMLPYSVALFLFLAAACLYARRLHNPSLRSGCVLAALGMFLVSFTVESLLVVYYALFVYFFWLSGRERMGTGTSLRSTLPASHGPKSEPVPIVSQVSGGDGLSRSRLIAFLRRHSPALALPLIFFVGRRILFPRAGQFSQYNQIQLSPFSFAKGLAVNLKRVVLDQIVDIWRFAHTDTRFFLILAAIALPVCFAAGFGPARDRSRRLTFRGCLGIGAYAALLYVAAFFAYSMVGKFPLINSYNCRHALLAIIPIAIGIVACLRFAVRSNSVFRWMMLCILLLCITVGWRNYILWENRFIKYQAIVENLDGRDSEVKPLVVVDDRANFGMPELLRGYEINWMLKRGLGNQRHLGVDARNMDEEHEAATLGQLLNEWDREIYMFRDFPDPIRTGPWLFDEDASELEVTAARTLSNLQIFCDYYRASSAERRQFVKSLVQLKIIPMRVRCELPPPPKYPL